MDREIKGLERCVLPHGRGCTPECEYHGRIECCRQVMRKALALLKEQKPRVITWQEVIGAALECKPVYIEVKNNEDKEPGDDRWAMVTQYKDSMTNGMIRAMSSYITSEILFKDWYGKSWRCWDKKPTDAQMEATPWE